MRPQRFPPQTSPECVPWTSLSVETVVGDSRVERVRKARGDSLPSLYACEEGKSRTGVGQGQRAPSEISPIAARMAKASPKPAYREVTSLSTFSVPTELPMSL
ncbi:MAG: hypothetical protein JWP61_2346 [Friedmanniella sp.]|nr:hypothetical protein [Friedmanniella sp.]